MSAELTALQPEEHLNVFLALWGDHFEFQDYQTCASLCQDFIGQLKKVYQSRSWGNHPEAVAAYANLYVFLMLAKGLEDVLQLVKHTADRTWPNSSEETEGIWYLLWDARERLDVFMEQYSHRGIQSLYHSLEKLESDFYAHFGRGLYLSPVLLVKKSRCNICSQNPKSCPHIPGEFYDGHLCRELVLQVEFQGADIVEYPKDMRCRIWPWNFTEDLRFTARLMNLTLLDAFIWE